MEVVHESVLLEECIKWLNPRDDKWYIDCTLGEGGHTEALLERFPAIRVLGIDQDPEIGERARERLRRFGERVFLYNGNFCDMDRAAQAADREISGILMDLGISSFHYETSERGFSFLKDEPLDMRLSPEWPESAADLLNRLDVKRLAAIISCYGEEPAAMRVARAVVRYREQAGPLSRSRQFAALVEEAIPLRMRPGRIHAATRTFQALRIAVNHELEVLEEALEKAVELLVSGGRLAVISFHSLEDRIVKRFFRDNRPRCRCPEGFPLCTCGRPGRLQLLLRKPVTATDQEIARNPRSRSAKLRVAEKL